jgi:CubicO group peptidase (beta-lactamase class C family)
MDAEGRAGRLQAALVAAGAGGGAVACRAAGSGPAARSWGSVPAGAAFEAGSVTKAVTGLLAPLGVAARGDLPRSALARPGRAWELGAYAPAGGWRATVDDLLRLAWVAARPEESPFPAAAADALTPRVAMNGGSVGWCWMIRPPGHGTVAWHNGATGAGWAFIGASRSRALAACVPEPRQAAWDGLALQALASDGGGDG